MAKRSGQVCAQAAPSAPEWTRCSQIVQPAALSDKAKKGTSGNRSRQRSRRRNHHAPSASTTGNVTVEGLLKIASSAHSSASA